MAMLRDFADERPLSVGHPRKNEERGASIVLGQQVENAANAKLDSAGQIIPAVSRDVRLERRDLEVLLDVDREVVPNRLTGVGDQ